MQPPAIGNWQVEHPIGEGASASVYAVHNRVAPTVLAAVKLWHQAQAPEQLAGEADALESLTHPGIVGIRDAGVHDGHPYLVMERLQGPTLQASPPPDTAALITELRQVADALAHAHARGVCHGDIKPGHLHREERGVVLVDFGLSWTGRGATPSFAPPEWFTGQVIDRAAQDVYALGLTIAALADTELPPPGPRRPPVDLGLEVPAQLRALVLRMTARRAEARPTMAQVLSRLTPATPEKVPARPRALPAALLGVVLVVSAGLLARRPTTEPAPAPQPAASVPEKPAPEEPPAAPAPVAAPAPEPAAAAPAQAPSPVRSPPLPAVHTAVELTGDHRQAWLVRDGESWAPGEVPPGSYEILALFSGVEPVPAGSITVEEGQVRTLRCASTMLLCRPIDD